MKVGKPAIDLLRDWWLMRPACKGTRTHDYRCWNCGWQRVNWHPAAVVSPVAACGCSIPSACLSWTETMQVAALLAYLKAAQAPWVWFIDQVGWVGGVYLDTYYKAAVNVSSQHSLLSYLVGPSTGGQPSLHHMPCRLRAQHIHLGASSATKRLHCAQRSRCCILLLCRTRWLSTSRGGWRM